MLLAGRFYLVGLAGVLATAVAGLPGGPSGEAPTAAPADRESSRAAVRFPVGLPRALAAEGGSLSFTVAATVDTWTGLPTAGAPLPRSQHSAVWTGSEMLIWGGQGPSGSLNDGARYNPSTRTWTELPREPLAPSGPAVWTGNEMIVWAGGGARYNPSSNSWSLVPTAGAPRAQAQHSAVWTGREMIIWGGATYGPPGPVNDGAAYNPSTDSWRALPSAGAPSARSRHTAVWTGSEMIVWGGEDNSGALNDGARYTPSTNSWTALPSAGAPSARSLHTAVWTGSEMIVWGGCCYLDDGARYSPSTNSWAALPRTRAPSGRAFNTAVWTGSEMIVWGGYGFSGYLSDGARYSPSTNSWAALPTGGAPSARDQHTAVWTGGEMIIWGGVIEESFRDGARYGPGPNAWTALPSGGAPSDPSGATAVWTGREMIVWGRGGARYDPGTDAWSPLSTVGAPAGRTAHPAVWTGSEMIVWGGEGDSPSGYGPLNDGARYNPATNAWAALPSAGAPSARFAHTAVWTGSEMIVWGGRGPSGDLNDGARYNPSTNSWTAVTSASAPSARLNHTAVWTGSEMIVWGGCCHLNDGARYNPSTNRWIALPETRAPSARDTHTAVWTGGAMIIWGGFGPTGFHNDGARYTPATNNWTALPSAGAPSARKSHTAVWTGSEMGSEMIIWGGYGPPAGALNDGARYDASANAWTALASGGAPSRRFLHTAVWTGSEMIVWGGRGDLHLGDGAGYAAAGVIGGRGFGLRLGPPVMDWAGGAAQVGYLIVRVSGSGASVLPPGGIPLPPIATTYTDTQASRDPFLCYLLIPVAPAGALGASDLLCGLPNTRTQGGAPDAFTVRLNQSTTATLTWRAPGPQDSYMLVAVPLGGGPPRQIALPGDTTRITENTGGVPTCYLLIARAGGANLSTTDVLCGVPGVSTLPSTPSPGQ